ncbi:hypothetical protein [Pseudonocardia sp. NPDC046786]|uniref:ABC transporter permease subunit n=1 Tax=Pseudonocardia sp. NPDC046786 TaxID=3155471 RepID=UPI0033EB723B
MILSVLVLAHGLITRRTVFGRHVYAIGGNLAAARLSGVKARAVTFWIFVNMGFLAGIAGVIYSARSNGAQPAAGTMFELDAIAAAFIGGAAVTGGVGTVVGALVGGLIMAVMSNGMQLMGVDQSMQSVVRGWCCWRSRSTSGTSAARAAPGRNPPVSRERCGRNTGRAQCRYE